MYNKSLVFWSACFGMLLFGVGLITLGSIAPDLKIKFLLDDVSAGTLFSILPIGILAGSLLFGPVCDRYGYKSMLVISCLAMFAGFEGIAFFSTFTFLKISIFIFGIGGGIINGATNALVSDISKGPKGADLSLLGVFFGIGALGMPFMLGFLKNRFSSFDIVGTVGWLTLVAGLFYSLIKLPSSKKELGFDLVKTKSLFRDSFLFFIAFYLFFQSSIEALVNNWTTSYLMKHLSVAESNALYALSLYVGGLTVMRLLIGSVLAPIKPKKLVLISLTIVLAGIFLLHFAQSIYLAIAGLIFLGIGLAAGFPIMLGLAGHRYAAQSGTAFSIILTIALFGNMLVNYLMGIISEKYGIQNLTWVALTELIFLIVFCFLILRTPDTRHEAIGNRQVARSNKQ